MQALFKRAWLLSIAMLFVVSCERKPSTDHSKTNSVKPTTDQKNARWPDIQAPRKTSALSEKSGHSDSSIKLSQKFLHKKQVVIPKQGVTLVIAGSNTCPASKGLRSVVDSMAPELEEANVKVLNYLVSDYEKMHNFSTPWMLLYKDGLVIDASKGGWMKGSTDWQKSNRKHVLHLLGRNNLGTKSRPSLHDTVDYIFQRRGLRNGSVENMDFAKRNLAPSKQTFDGFNFSSSVLSGTSFEGTSLKKADFSDSLAVNASFLDADLTDADLLDSVWINVICPDGSLSQKNGFNCSCCRTSQQSLKPK